jgi:hypothetical protein
MKRFLMLVAVAAVAGAMYVAAAPGSQRAAGPTATQFATLKKQVASLSKKLKALKTDESKVKGAAAAAVTYIAACFLDSNGNIENLPVNEFGSTTTGFLFGAPGGAPATARSALDVDSSGSPLAFLQELTPACLTSTAQAQASAHSGLGLRVLHAERTR